MCAVRVRAAAAAAAPLRIGQQLQQGRQRASGGAGAPGVILGRLRICKEVGVGTDCAQQSYSGCNTEASRQERPCSTLSDRLW